MLSMCTNPLNDYFSMGGDSPRFANNCTALWETNWVRKEEKSGYVFVNNENQNSGPFFLL
jgi:hypothetical protein